MAIPFAILEPFNAQVISIFCIFFIFSISLFKKWFFDFPIREIFFAILLGQILSIVIVMINVKIQSLENKYKWVRREWMLLKALIEDVECVSKSVNETADKALRLWGSEPSLGVTLQLNQSEKAWLETTKKVVHVAESCVKSYQRLTERRQFPTWSYSIFWDWIDIKILHFEVDQVKDGIENLFMSREESFRHICGSLERSRSIIRNLQDRPIGGEDESFVYKRAGPTLSLSSNNLIGTIPNLVLLNLLLTFLRDLEGHRFESETEKAWVKEAEELFGELQRETESINSLLKLLLAFLTDLEGLVFKRETEQAWVKEAVKIIGIDFLQKLANPRRWSSYFKNSMARRKLRKSCNCTETLLRDLFQRKILFGFSFIRREPPKSVRRSPHQLMFSAQAIDDMGIVPLLAIINRYLPLNLPATASHQITQLHNQFQEVHKLLMEAKAVGGIKHSIISWTDQLKNIVKDAENSLKTYRQRQSSVPNETDPWFKFSAEVRRFMHTLSLLELSIKVCRTEPREEKNMVVGLEDDIHKVVSQLITNTEHCYTVSVVGMMGIGKTTLAKIIYNHRDIRDHFNHRAWASIPDMVAEDEVLKIVGNQVLSTHEERNEREYWIMKLRDFLSSAKSLLVLDNITSVEVWDTLKEVFPVTTNGSRILLTTRYKRVASRADQSGVHNQLRLRTKEQSWSLFQQMVDLQPELSHEVNTLASKVVGRCGGLPLSILHLGYLMSGKKVTLEELSIALEHINHVQTPWSEILDINEEDLYLRLRQCLSYFAHLPRDSEISARRLVTLWVAELLTVFSNYQQSQLEEWAETYLSDLIDRNLIQVVEQKLNGKVKTYGFPSALQDLWQQDNSTSTRTTTSWYPGSWIDKRLVCHFDENKASYSDSYGSSINSPDTWRKYRNLRSFLFFDAQKRYNSGKKIGIFLDWGITNGHLLQLQILDLEHVFRPQLPKSITKLRHLTYLGLRWTYLETIPSSIGKLVNLETLDIKHTHIRILPISIWGLPKLKHLYLNDIHRSKIIVQPSQNFLQNLQILQNAFVDQISLRRNGLDRLKNLRKLSLAFKLNLSQQNELQKSLVQLTQLQSLKLKSIDERGKPESLEMMQLSTLENLSSLYLFGTLVSGINIKVLPQRLTDLTLSASGLLTNPMKDLEKLSGLKSLSFYSHSCAGTRISCSNGGFPQLLVLKFWMLSKLKEWEIQRHAMPNLKQLEIRSCQNLEVPTGLRHLKTLRELKLKDMPERFTETIEETKDQIWGAANSPAILVDVQ